MRYKSFGIYISFELIQAFKILYQNLNTSAISMNSTKKKKIFETFLEAYVQNIRVCIDRSQKLLK